MNSLSSQDLDLLKNYISSPESRLCIVREADGREHLGKVRTRELYWFQETFTWGGINPSLKAVSDYLVKKEFHLETNSKEFRTIHEIASLCLFKQVDGIGRVALLWQKLAGITKDVAFVLVRQEMSCVSYDRERLITVGITPLSQLKHVMAQVEILVNIPYVRFYQSHVHRYSPENDVPQENFVVHLELEPEFIAISAYPVLY